MSENEIIEKRFRVLAALWLLFCFFAAQQYAEASNLEGLFMRFFMYGIFAAPVWLVYGWKYLYGERQITRKILLLVGATYFAWACAADNHYSDDLNKQQILIFLSYVYFVVLAIPYSVIPTLLHKMRWKLIMATPPHTPMQSTPDEVLVLDLFWVRGVRKARGQPKDSLEAMGRDKILEIMRRVKKHWLEIIEGIKPETRISAQISQASLEQISKMIKIFEDEFKLPKELCIPNWADEKKALENQQAPSTSTVSPEAQQFMMKLVMENVCENVADMIEDLAEQDWGELHADEILLMAAKQVREMAQHKMPNKP